MINLLIKAIVFLFAFFMAFVLSMYVAARLIDMFREI